jgi:hypothetical protein
MELMQLVSDQAMEVAPERSFVLQCSIQGKAALFLIDSGSSNSFLSAALATNLPGKLPLSRPCKVKVAGGGILPCTHYVPDCSWSYRNLTFSSSFKILPLAHYDGIVGMDGCPPTIHKWWIRSRSGLPFNTRALGSVSKVKHPLNLHVLWWNCNYYLKC